MHVALYIVGGMFTGLGGLFFFFGINKFSMFIGIMSLGIGMVCFIGAALVGGQRAAHGLGRKGRGGQGYGTTNIYIDQRPSDSDRLRIGGKKKKLSRLLDAPYPGQEPLEDLGDMEDEVIEAEVVEKPKKVKPVKRRLGKYRRKF